MFAAIITRLPVWAQRVLLALLVAWAIALVVSWVMAIILLGKILTVLAIIRLELL